MQFAQGPGEIPDKFGIGPFDAAGAADQDMVGPGNSGIGEDMTGEFTETPLHPVAHDRIAHLLRNCEAEPHGGIVVAAWADEQDEAGRRRTQGAIGREEFRATPELVDLARIRAVAGFGYADSFLRPRLRRAAMTLRPPTVAILCRKPCRRLRTRLLGWKVRFIAHSS